MVHSQIFPVPRECVRKIVAAIAWYNWQGAIFVAPISTLQRKKIEGDGS